MDKQWKVVPVEADDDMEVAAENDYEATGATFPDWKSAYRAMLAAAPQPPSASDERETVQCNCPGGTKSAALHAPNCPVRLRDAVLIDPYDGGTWVAPSPGVDAAEQTRAALKQTQSLLVGMLAEIETQIRDNRAALDAAPSPAASADEWMAEAERLVAANEQAYCDASLRGTEPYWSIARASRLALLAHLKARP